MEYKNIKLVLSKLNNRRLHLHLIFILLCLSAQPLFYSLYSREPFSWSVAFSYVYLLFYTLLLTSIYFTTFIVLRSRPYLLKQNSILLKIVGIVCVFFLFIGFRWVTDQYLLKLIAGFTNYPENTSFSFFFHDNLIYAAFVIVFSFFVKFMDDWYTGERVKTMLESQNMRLELDFLKSQVNPHFLFNTLNNIQSYIVQDEKMKSIELIGRLSEFMRFALYECNEEYIEINKEINMMRDYVELERVRCDDRVNITFRADGEFSDYKIPPLLLMPFVENAFKHGADMQLSKSWITITIDQHDGELHLQVKNSFDPDSEQVSDEKSGGIGLQNVKKRLNHYFNTQHNLQIIKNNNVFEASLKLQLELTTK